MTGKIRALGLSNFNLRQIINIVENCSIKPQVVQIECHPYLPETDLINYCQKMSIHVQAFSPLFWSMPKEEIAKAGGSRRDSVNFSSVKARNESVANQHELVRKSFSASMRQNLLTAEEEEERMHEEFESLDGRVQLRDKNGNPVSQLRDKNGNPLTSTAKLDANGLPTICGNEDAMNHQLAVVKRLSDPTKSWSKYHVDCIPSWPFDMFTDDYNMLDPYRSAYASGVQRS